MVRDDTFRRLYWCDPDVPDDCDEDEDDDEDDVTLVSEDWKLSIDDICLLVKVVYRWKLSFDES